MNSIDVHENVPLEPNFEQNENVVKVLARFGIIPGDFAIDETDNAYEVTLVSKTLLECVREAPAKVNGKFLNFVVPGIQSFLI